MARKRLTDLLEEEVQKPIISSEEPAITVAAETIIDQTTSSSPEDLTSQKIQDLETIIQDLRASLEESHRKELYRQQEIKDLHSDLNKQKSLAEKLSNEVEETKKNTLKSFQKKELELQQEIKDLRSDLSEQKSLVEKFSDELEETKKTALQLAEANSQLIEENNSFKQVQVKEIVKAPIKESYNPLSYRKSHRSPERLQEQPTQSNDDFADNTWLYD